MLSQCLYNSFKSLINQGQERLAVLTLVTFILLSSGCRQIQASSQGARGRSYGERTVAALNRVQDGYSIVKAITISPPRRSIGR